MAIDYAQNYPDNVIPQARSPQPSSPLPVLKCPPDETFQNITVKSHRLGKYRVQQSLRTNRFELVQIWPTNVFTPNGDGVNDEINFIIDNPKESIVSGEIYDINGVFMNELSPGKDNFSLFWDGKDKDGDFCRKGIYIYQIKAEGKIINGTVILAK